jgi:hypothetical protein
VVSVTDPYGRILDFLDRNTNAIYEYNIIYSTEELFVVYAKYCLRVKNLILDVRMRNKRCHRHIDMLTFWHFISGILF